MRVDDDAFEFARVLDKTLTRLEKYIESDINHHPKFYVWLPGIALCSLAVSAGLPMDWLRESGAKDISNYARLPLELL